MTRPVLPPGPRLPACDHCGSREKPTATVLRNNWPNYHLCKECSALPPSPEMDERIKDRLWDEGRWMIDYDRHDDDEYRYRY